MGHPAAARVVVLRWLLLVVGLIGLGLALTAQPAQAGITDRVTAATKQVSTSTSRTVDRVRTTSTIVKAKPVARVSSAPRATVHRVAGHRPRAHRTALTLSRTVHRATPLIKKSQLIKKAPLIKKTSRAVHRSLTRVTHPVATTLKHTVRQVRAVLTTLPEPPSTIAPVIAPVLGAVARPPFGLVGAAAAPATTAVVGLPTTTQNESVRKLALPARAHVALLSSPTDRPTTGEAPADPTGPGLTPWQSQDDSGAAPCSPSTATGTGAGPASAAMADAAGSLHGRAHLPCSRGDQDPWSSTADPGFAPD